MKTYNISFSPLSFSMQDLLSFLDTRSEILNWYTPFSGMVIVVSNYLPNYLTKLISEKFPRNQFLITEANVSSIDGRLPNTAWNFLQNPQNHA